MASAQKSFYRIAEATERLKPRGVAAVLSLCVYVRFDLVRLRPDRFRTAHPRTMEPAGLPELFEGKVNVLIHRSLRHHPEYRCERLENGSGVWHKLSISGQAALPSGQWLRDVHTSGPVTAVRRSG